MLRYSLRLLSKAAEHAKPVVAASSTAAVPEVTQDDVQYPEHLKPYFEGNEKFPTFEPLPENPTDQQLEDHFSALMSSPIIQGDPAASKAYNEFLTSERQLNNYNPLPEYQDSETPVTIDWEFGKKYLPAETVEAYQNVLAKALAEVDTWAKEDMEFFEYAEKKIKREIESVDLRELEETMAVIDKQIKDNEEFIKNLESITIEDAAKQHPDIEQEIYEEITNNEWMPKEKMGDTLQDAANRAHHH
eukprot:gene6791-8426_t